MEEYRESSACGGGGYKRVNWLDNLNHHLKWWL